MNTYVEVNGIQYPASITGRLCDRVWNDRESKAIKLEMTYSDAVQIFTDDVKWNIVQDFEETIMHTDEETGETTFEVVTKQEVYDNSEFSVAGDIVDHRDGNVTVKMGKSTAAEILAMLEEVL